MSDNTQNNKRIAMNSLFLNCRMVVVLLVSLFTTREILRALGVIDYGVYNVVCGFVYMFGFLNTSMSNGIQRFLNYALGENNEGRANQVYCTAVYIQILLSIAIVLILETIGIWYLHNKMVIPADRKVAADWIFQFAIATFAINIMQAPLSAVVIAHEKFNLYSILSILDALLKLGIAFIVQWIPSDNLIWYGFLISLISSINILVYYFYCLKHFQEIHLKRGLDRTLFKEMLGFSGWNILGSFSGVMKEHGINLVLNFFFGPIVNAARGVASYVNAAIQGFANNITTPVRPQVIQSYAQGNLKRTFNLTFSISKLGSCFFLMMAIPVSIEIDYVLKLWLGETVPDHTNYFTIIILATSLISILNGAISTIVHATGIMKQYQIWGSIIKICSVPIAFFTLKIYPIPELALLIVFVCSVFSHIISLIIVRNLVGLSTREYTKEILLPLCLICFIAYLSPLPLHFFLHEGILRLIVVTIVSCTIIGIIAYFGVLNSSERQLLLMIIKNIHHKK